MSGVREHEIGIAAAILATRDRQEARASVQHYLERERYSRKPLDRTLSETIRQLHSDEGEAAQTSAIGPDQSNLVDPGRQPQYELGFRRNFTQLNVSQSDAEREHPDTNAGTRRPKSTGRNARSLVGPSSCRPSGRYAPLI